MYEIIPIKDFLKDLKELSKIHQSILRDMDALAQNLKSNPLQGVKLGKDCYKIRLAITSKGKGKSGWCTSYYLCKDNSEYSLPFSNF